MQTGFIGAGKVGVSLGKYFKEKGLSVSGYYSRTAESARFAAEFTETKQYGNLEEVISSSDMIFFTVPDDVIAAVWEEAKPFCAGKIVAHCSGLCSSNIFSDSKKTGCSAYSIHPLLAISDKENSYGQLDRALFTIEGDEDNISKIQQLFIQTGNRMRIISANDKARYHGAASLASNHMTAVFYMAEKLFMECGFTEEEARRELLALAKGNLENIEKQGVVASLTGPIERGDCSTVEKHLKSVPLEIWAAYRENGKQLVEIAQKKHPDRNYENMKTILERQE